VAIEVLRLEKAEIKEIAMPYLSGNALRIRAKAVGKLKLQ